MIVPMKKATIFVQSKDADGAINELRSLGILHVEHHKAPAGKEIEIIASGISMLSEAINILSEQAFINRAARERDAKTPRPAKDWKTAALHIIDARKRFEQLKEYSVTLKAMITEWGRWGDFEPEEINELSEKGMFIELYQIPVKKLNTIPEGIFVKKIFTKGEFAHCVLVSQSRIDIPYKEIMLPKMGPDKMQARLSEDAKVMDSIRKAVSRFVTYKNTFQETKRSLEKELEFNHALKGMGEDSEIAYISGFIPHDAEALIKDASKREKWGLLVDDVSDEDKVPTLIRNPRWVSIINPVFKMIEIVPGYSELDISMWFLIFFSIFFGILIGDAGLGAVYFILTLIFHRKLKNILNSNALPILFYLLSFCAIIWGVLTATFFGQEWLSPYFKPLVPALNDYRNMQNICFVIGAFQLSIAHIWRAVIKAPSIAALSEFGWVLILWGAFFLARTMVLAYPFPKLALWFLSIGAVVVIIFTSPNRNIIKGIGAGLGSLLKNLVNSFTDIVSYVRLFAVGLATVAVADAFNKLALDIGFNGFFAGIATSLILILGQVLNVLLGPMSILVHGVRLNVLEFCSHLEVTWSGFSYKPLKK
ncbi:MAG: hypothetical protein KKD29_01680 [Candidatus Omnitrophica bacterium]|nr:hypothetical protein [Candidatus Omnitrophota bacterium]MBU4488176.1 hypothetical protein [Candidatus Omnitrophota bacterium]MCG2704610.1 hypothetical protein [Candidatus Omnitrophota bacterium]